MAEKSTRVHIKTKTDTRPSCKTTFLVSVKMPTYAGRRARSFAQIDKIVRIAKIAKNDTLSSQD
jgi:hypothetical protein